MVEGKSHWNLGWAAAGFTLVELMVTIGVVAILAAIAAPALQSLIASNELTSITDSFATALNEARSEAGRQGVPVALYPNDGQNWTNGWTMFVDSNSNGKYDTGETLVRTGGGLPSGYTLKSTLGYSTLISFDNTGRLYPAGGGVADFVICQNGSFKAGSSQLITVATSGQVRIVQPNSSGNLVDDASTQVSACSF